MPTVACTLQVRTIKAPNSAGLQTLTLTFTETGNAGRLGNLILTYLSNDTDFAAASALALGAAGNLTY